mmetsp:Transcript_10846/g.50006  ORF Transcript_10846/g.50006 Transcript_10846/m.50006 type:complete len:224 (-) Transcript_10846:194-865(-)
MDDSTNVLNLFLIDSMLSSVRPDVSPRPSSLRSITSSGQSKNSTKSQSYPAVTSHASRFSLLRGKPSMRNLDLPESAIASSNRRTVTTDGTICPFLIISATMLPSSLPLFMCARRRSPAERWTKPKSLTMLEHCVPLPAPGPPRTNTTVGLFVDAVAPWATPSAPAGAASSPSAHSATAVGVNAAAVAKAPAAAKPKPRAAPGAVRLVIAACPSAARRGARAS